MPTVNISPKVRFALYLISAIGSAAAAYLFAKGYVGDAELGLWAAVVAIVNTLSAANTNLSGEPVVKVRDAVVEGDVEDGYPILGKAFTGGTFSKAEEDARARDEKGQWSTAAVVVVALLGLIFLALIGVFR